MNDIQAKFLLQLESGNCIWFIQRKIWALEAGKDLILTQSFLIG